MFLKILSCGVDFIRFAAFLIFPTFIFNITVLVSARKKMTKDDFFFFSQTQMHEVRPAETIS